MVTEDVFPIPDPVKCGDVWGRFWVRIYQDEATRMITKSEFCWSPGLNGPPPDEDMWNAQAEYLARRVAPLRFHTPNDVSLAHFNHQLQFLVRNYNSRVRVGEFRRQ